MQAGKNYFLGSNPPCKKEVICPWQRMRKTGSGIIFFGLASNKIPLDFYWFRQWADSHTRS